MDSRFVYPDPPGKRYGEKQALQGTELVTILPSNKSDTLYEFELPSKQSTYLFSARTGFKVKGVFEFKASATAADNTYDKIPEADYATLQLQPNWFEMLVKSVDVFHNNASVRCHDVPRYADMWLNTYLYSVMDDEIKRCLFPETNSPGRAVPTKIDGWTLAANSEWHEYSKKLFGKPSIVFRYVPTFVFPFYQQANFCSHGERPPAAIPMSILNKMTISLQLKEKFDGIFRQTAANTKAYRFRIESIELMVEEARLSSPFERSYLSRTKPLLYSGVTKFGIVENINNAVLQHRIQFPSVEMPEGLFIFALPNTVTGGEYKYQTLADASVGKNIFSKTNIESVEISFQDYPLAIKTPNLGNIRDHIIEIAQYIDHMEYPPFGVYQNLEKLTLDDIKEAGEYSLFPHIYINLCPSGNKTRLIGHGDEGRSIDRLGNLDLNVKFATDGANAGLTYFFYIFYTDYNVYLDYKEKQFVPYYKRNRPNI